MKRAMVPSKARKFSLKLVDDGSPGMRGQPQPPTGVGDGELTWVPARGQLLRALEQRRRFGARGGSRKSTYDIGLCLMDKERGNDRGAATDVQPALKLFPSEKLLR